MHTQTVSLLLEIETKKSAFHFHLNKYRINLIQTHYFLLNTIHTASDTLVLFLLSC